MPAPGATDLIDRVDERNLVRGVVQRAQALPHGANFRTTHGILNDERGRILVQRLSPRRRRHPNRLGSSVAGYLHAGEAPRAAITRRTEEELGISPTFTSLGWQPVRDERSTKFVAVFIGSGLGATIREPEQIDSLLWMFPREIDALVRNEDTCTPTFISIWRAVRDRVGP